MKISFSFWKKFLIFKCLGQCIDKKHIEGTLKTDMTFLMSNLLTQAYNESLFCTSINDSILKTSDSFSHKLTP